MLSFSRQNRLVSQQDFQSVFASGNKLTLHYFIARYRDNHLAQPRLGIIISKRIIRQAVQRNLIRRVVRESFRQHKELIKGLDLIVMMRSKCSPLEKKSLREDAEKLWQIIAKLPPKKITPSAL